MFTRDALAKTLTRSESWTPILLFESLATACGEPSRHYHGRALVVSNA